MLSKLLLSLSLAVAPIVSVSAQAGNTFDTFQTIDKYLQDFDYLIENSYRVSEGNLDLENSRYDVAYSGEPFVFYSFPIYYEVDSCFYRGQGVEYYSNDNYVFFTISTKVNEMWDSIIIENYIGIETKMPFLALDYIGMWQVIEHDKTEKSNSISIYNSFYNFFTGFFPNEVVAEYHGIFTFIIVAFLLFLVFGFVFFLFRVIRRLVGFK
ncbi:MAG TPA: hypothetical protein GX708_04515 [Gallicola sp.]|nr:hypothetical protein [Gallicola sp.]